MTLFLVLASAAAIIFVVWPAVRGTQLRWEYSDEDTPLGRLAVRKDVLVGNLADLDFEFEMGKVTEEDYRSLRDSLKRQTLKIMEQMEVLASGEPATVAPPAVKSGTCSSCGGAIPPQARFCPSCGTRLEG
jgi:hypothetical protein